MKRRKDDRPSKKARLMGDGRRFTDAEGAARIAKRLPSSFEGVDLDIIQTMVDQFQDVPVGNGFFRRDRLRRDPLYVLAWMLRRSARLPPRKIADALGLTRAYVKFCLPKGRALVEAATTDGRLDAALDTLHRQRLDREGDR